MNRAVAQPGPRSAFTLVEVLVVMGIVAILAALTVMSMAAIGRRAAREGAAEQVMRLLRQARASAIDGRRGAVVFIDTADRSLRGLATQVIGAWHFEEVMDLDGDGNPDTPGARRLHAALQPQPGGPAIEPQGRVGMCLRFDGADDYVDCGNYPVYDQTTGIRLEAWVKPEGTGYMPVLAKYDPAGPTGYGLGLYSAPPDTSVYAVHAGFEVIDAAGNRVDLHLTSVDPTSGEGIYARQGRWHHLAAEFDGFEGRLFLDGVLVDLDSYRDDEASPTPPAQPNPSADPNPYTDRGFEPPARLVMARNEPLLAGYGRYDPDGPGPAPVGDYYFQGLIDEPRVLSIAGGDPVVLPERVALWASEPVIHFDREGRLDVAYHAEPVWIAVGDPYQAATVASDAAAGAAVLTVGPSNPFPPTGGYVLVGPQGGPYELVHYSSADGRDLQLAPDRAGNWGTVTFDHPAGEQVLFARVVGVDMTGAVKRVGPH